MNIKVLLKKSMSNYLQEQQPEISVVQTLILGVPPELGDTLEIVCNSYRVDDGILIIGE